MSHTDDFIHSIVFRSTKAQIEGPPKTIDFMVEMCFSNSTCLYLLYLNKLFICSKNCMNDKEGRLNVFYTFGNFSFINSWRFRGWRRLRGNIKHTQRQFCKGLIS